MFAAEKGEKNKKKVKTKDKSPLLEFPNAAADVQPYAFTKSSDCDGDGGGTAASTKDSLSPRLQEFVECTAWGKRVVPQHALIGSARGCWRPCWSGARKTARVFHFWG
ncbi:uncharacterized protein LOC105797193 isoform X1 [Gossypium raimondii]|uniref:uncharacterized protein LOC105797193 isoform X1 n=1 Tax=Gossypium raimondii TaxID=29730 RepID=UPI00063AA31A|nr:uncharacterized protein LOC105797193 isoform X1 [Gossypium raimondii]